MAQYIGVNVRPDVCALVQLIVPGKEPPTQTEKKLFNNFFLLLNETIKQGLDYVHVDMNTARLVLLTDASFANARGLKRQLGYLIIIVDEEGNCNILLYGSNRCRRVEKSVMAAKLFALVLGYNHAYIIRTVIDEIAGIKLAIEALVESNTAFDLVAKYTQTTENVYR